jgi:uncharacterized protein DUF1569
MLMKTLSRSSDLDEIRVRLARLRPDSRPGWGRMNASQMVCHLTDAFRNVLGERPTASATAPAGRVRGTLIKWFALYAPVRWPRGVRTRPESDQEQGGTPPTDFAADRDALLAACDRFLAGRAVLAQRPHFLFGRLTEAEWARWAYLHMDHHLRQFGL